MKKVFLVLALALTTLSAATTGPSGGGKQPPPAPCKSGITTRSCPPGPLVPGR